MERQNQSRTAQTQEQTQREQSQKIQHPERERLSSAGLTAQLALEGVSLLDLPPQRLEELAGTLGNSAMQALVDAQAPLLEEAGFRMPAGEPDTAAFPVPETQPPALARPVGLTETVSTGPAADPTALVV